MDKEIRKKVLGRAHQCLVKAPAGLHGICRDEMEHIVSHSWQHYKFTPEITEYHGHILVSPVDFRLVLEILLRARTARDLLIGLGSGRVGSYGELKDLLSSISWHLFLQPQQSITVTTRSQGSYLYHEGKIRDTLKNLLEQRSYQLSDDGIPLQLILQDNRAQVWLSLAGQPLYKRGFKQVPQTKAPLAEHLAATLLKPLINKDYDFVVVPFAGSGTLGFEYCMERNGIIASHLGRGYAVQSMPCCPPKTLQFLMEKLKPGAEPVENATYVFIERDQDQVSQLQANIESFHKALQWSPRWLVEDGDAFAFDMAKLCDKSVLLPMNPPYGLRLKPGNVEKFYVQLADWILAIDAKASQLSGFCLVASDRAYGALRFRLGKLYSQTLHLNQGGLHVRAVYFNSWSDPGSEKFD